MASFTKELNTADIIVKELKEMIILQELTSRLVSEENRQISSYQSPEM